MFSFGHGLLGDGSVGIFAGGLGFGKGEKCFKGDGLVCFDSGNHSDDSNG